jgi:hypothetical protein
MDGTRIDALSKSLARGMTRRGILRRGGGVGAAAGLAAVLGTRAVAAQDATPAAGMCAIPLELAVRQGPNAGVAWRGELRLSADESGGLSGVYAARKDEAGTAVESGTTDADPMAGTQELPVVGQANGRAINLMITVADGQYVFGVGTLENDISQCGGEMGGPFVGPEPGDTGDWAPCGVARCVAAGGTQTYCSQNVHQFCASVIISQG